VVETPVVEAPTEPGLAPGGSGDWAGIEVYCECGHLFRARRSLKGGITNRPRCGRAVAVPGGPEAPSWLILGGGGALVLGVAAAIYAAGSVEGAVIALVLGAVGITVHVLSS
jgi:hypothetical protein